MDTNTAIQLLKQTSGFSFELVSQDFRLTSDFICDAVLKTRAQQKEMTFWLLKSEKEVKENPKYLLALNRAAKNLKAGIIFMAPSISNKLKKEFEERGISYLDIEAKKASIGRPLNTNKIRYDNSKTLSIASPSSLALQLLFLYRVKDVNLSFDKMGKATETSAATAHKAFKELQSLGLIIPTGDGQRGIFQKKDGLIFDWIENYNKKVRQKNLLGTYRFINTSEPKLISMVQDYQFDQIIWAGGDLGANEQGGNIAPKHYSFYTKEESLNSIKRGLKLIPDKQGPVSIYRKFWNFEWNKDGLSHTAPPIVVAADLMNENEPRATNVAREILMEWHNVKSRD